MKLNAMQLILASNSKGRKSMLENAGLKFKTIPANINEKEIIENLTNDNKSVDEITLELAKEKSLFISRKHPEFLVIGSDQTLVLNNKILSKARDVNEASDKLKSLRGNTHTLNSAVCVSQNNKILFNAIDSAELTMKNFDDNFLDSYISKAKDDLTSCVGAYAIEAAGSWLFSSIKGNYFTIIGLPLLPLLSFLESKGFRP